MTPPSFGLPRRDFCRTTIAAATTAACGEMSFDLLFGVGEVRAAQASASGKTGGAASNSLPPLDTVRKIVERRFVSLPDRHSNDLISQSDVQPVFAELATVGWNVADQQQILQAILPDSHFLVKQLRSKRGIAFMRKTSSEALIYDRLDRVSEQRGGQQMIGDLIRLPDGHRYVKQKTAPGVPGMLDLLPKDSSASKRTIVNYDKPTEKIYTQAQFWKRLDASYGQALARELRSASAAGR